MKKMCVFFIKLMLLLTLVVGCSTDGKEITSKKAEEIALQQFEIDLREFNNDSDEEIKMNEVELVTNETNLDTQKKTWEVKFNFINGHTKKNVGTNAVAQYSITTDGQIVGKVLSFK